MMSFLKYDQNQYVKKELQEEEGDIDWDVIMDDFALLAAMKPVTGDTQKPKI